jgi:WD40 repeat protein
VVQNEHSGVAPAALGLVSASDGVAVAKGASYYRPRRECRSDFTVPFRRDLYFNSWFPDSKTVLYTDAGPDSSELKLWNTASGSQKTLMPRGSSGSLSPDGRYVAFLAPVHESATTWISKQALLKIMDLRSERIVASREIPNVLPPVQWSPSTSYLAVLTADSKLLLARFTPAGIELRQTQLTEPDFYHELSWSPDGKCLAVWDEASGLKILILN